MKAENEKFICVLPWNHAYVSNDGSFHPCCLSKSQTSHLCSDTNGPIKINDKDAFLEARKSAQIEEMRRQMLSGAVPEQCLYCSKIESNGRKSYRQYVNELFPDTYEKIKSLTNLNEIDIEFFDLRVGNLCNLKCRMCGPHSSSALQEEFNLFFNTDDNNYSVLEDSTFDFVLQVASTIKRINIAGGEPFLMKSVLSLISKLALHENAKNITLAFNTNLTLLDPEFLKHWKNFRKVELAVSIDGINALNHYIRHPSNWTHIITNIASYRPHAEVHINCTVQIYNIFYLEEMFNYFVKEQGLHLNLSLLSDPGYLSIKALPPPLKILATQKLSRLLEVYPACEDIQPTINFMNSDDTSNQFAQFKKWTNFLDKNRGESFLELAPLFKDYF